MDPSCRWQCGTANTTAVQQTRLAPPEQEAFCNGAGTDMFMQGFQVYTTTIIRCQQDFTVSPSEIGTLVRKDLT